MDSGMPGITPARSPSCWHRSSSDWRGSTKGDSIQGSETGLDGLDSGSSLIFLHHLFINSHGF